MDNYNSKIDLTDAVDDSDPKVVGHTFNLADAIDALFEQIQKEDVSDAVPAHNAFEVEDINTRQNFVFIKRDETVDLFDTSRSGQSSFGFNKQLMKTFGPFDFPFETSNAEEYYLHMYRKALRAEDNICFIGYVVETEESFEPVEDEL